MDQGASRTLNYLECIRLIQNYLNNMAHGELMKWCKDNDLTYNTMLGIKSDKINFFAPNLVADALRAMGYQVWSMNSKIRSNRKDVDKEEARKAKMLETFYIVKRDEAGENTSSPAPEM